MGGQGTARRADVGSSPASCWHQIGATIFEEKKLVQAHLGNRVYTNQRSKVQVYDHALTWKEGERGRLYRFKEHHGRVVCCWVYV